MYYRDKKGRLVCQVHAKPGYAEVTNPYPETCWLCDKRMALLRDRYRTLCRTCYNDRYNYQSSGDRMNAPTTGKGCWFLEDIHPARGKKPAECKLRR